MRATATDPDTGATLTSNPGTYAFSVGDGAAGQPDLPSSLAIHGLADHYHTGDTVSLTAVPDVATDLDHYHWYTRDNASDSWSVVPGLGGAEFTGTADHDGRQIKAALFGDDHAVVAESEPVTVHIDDHGEGEEPIGTVLTVTGAEGHFHPGDTVELTAVQEPATDLDHYHWFTRPDAPPPGVWPATRAPPTPTPSPHRPTSTATRSRPASTTTTTTPSPPPNPSPCTSRTTGTAKAPSTRC